MPVQEAHLPFLLHRKPMTLSTLSHFPRAVTKLGKIKLTSPNPELWQVHLGASRDQLSRDLPLTKQMRGRQPAGWIHKTAGEGVTSHTFRVFWGLEGYRGRALKDTLLDLPLCHNTLKARSALLRELRPDHNPSPLPRKANCLCLFTDLRSATNNLTHAWTVITPQPSHTMRNLP